MPGTENEATEDVAPATDGAMADESANDAQEGTTPEGDEPELDSEEEDTEDESAEAGDTGEEESDDQPDDLELDDAGLDQFPDLDLDDEDADNDDPPKFKRMELDADAATNKERWDEQQDGLEKIANRLEAQRQRLSEQEATVKHYASIDRAMQTQEGHQNIVAQLIKQGQTLYGDGYAVPGLQPETSASNNWWEDEDEAETPKPQEPAKILPQHVLDALKEAGLDVDTLKAVNAEAKARQESAALVSKAEKALPAVNRELQTDYPGARLTADHLAKAMQAYPSLHPLQAVELAYGKQLRAKLQNRPGKKKGKTMPTLTKGTKQTNAKADASLDDFIKANPLLG